jgi:hypothetical protein
MRTLGNGKGCSGASHSQILARYLREAMSKPDPSSELSYAIPAGMSSDATVITEGKTRLVIATLLSMAMAGGGMAIFVNRNRIDQWSSTYGSLGHRITVFAVATGVTLWLFGTLLIALGVWRLQSSRRAMIVDDVGITDLRTKLGLIPWSQITAVRLRESYLSPMLYLAVLDVAAIRSQRPAGAFLIWDHGTRAHANANEIAIPVQALSVKPRNLLALIQQHQNR